MPQRLSLCLGLSCTLALLSLGCAGTEMDHRENSPHFKNGKFHNTNRHDSKSFWDYFSMRLSTDYAEWPDWVETPTDLQPLQRVDEVKIRVTFVNHATFLIQTHGFSIHIRYGRLSGVAPGTDGMG